MIRSTRILPPPSHGPGPGLSKHDWNNLPQASYTTIIIIHPHLYLTHRTVHCALTRTHTHSCHISPSRCHSPSPSSSSSFTIMLVALCDTCTQPPAIFPHSSCLSRITSRLAPDSTPLYQHRSKGRPVGSATGAYLPQTSRCFCCARR